MSLVFLKVDGLVQPCHVILDFKPAEPVFQLILENSESMAVVRCTQDIKQELPENIFSRRGENADARCFQFPHHYK